MHIELDNQTNCTAYDLLICCGRTKAIMPFCHVPYVLCKCHECRMQNVKWKWKCIHHSSPCMASISIIIGFANEFNAYNFRITDTKSNDIENSSLFTFFHPFDLIHLPFTLCLTTNPHFNILFVWIYGFESGFEMENAKDLFSRLSKLIWWN